jgi:TonB-dependent Receptor Plug Domain
MRNVSYRALMGALVPFAVAGALVPQQARAQPLQATPGAPSALPDLKDGKRIFTPSYFAADNPNTAADMVGRVPGFSLDNGDSARGFGGTAGNVVIDGARPTSKDEGLQSILSRIPAANVEQIELLEGAAAGALAPGKTQVVNVVRKANSKSGGTWEAGINGVGSWRLLPSIEASYTARLGRLNVTLGINTEYDDVEDLIGYEGFLTPGGDYLERGPNDDRRRRRYGQLTLGADGTYGAYKISANGSWFRGVFRRNYNHIATLTGASLPYRVDEGRETNDETNWEVGGDIERDIFGWTGKLALLAKSGDQAGSSLAGFNLIGPARSYDRFVSEDITSERVGRVTFKRKFGTHQIETGGEYAFNSLDTTGIFSQGQNGNFVILPSNISSTVVEEDRREAFISDSWTLTPQLTLEATWTGEWSTISQSGDAAKERSFFYPKPRLKAVWKPSALWSARAEVVREVGQLDFGAFADSASVGDGTQNSGNPELRPEQNWAYRIGVEKRWGNRGVFDVGLVYKQIEDQLTLVPTGGGGVGLGNIREATLWGYSLSWTVPLDDLAKGLEVGGSYGWRDSDLFDPLTGRSRPFSGNKGNSFDANIRYDLPEKKLKIGAWVFRGEARRDYRPSQLFEWSTLTFWGAWIETRAIKGFTAEFGVENPFGNTFSRLRTDYASDRRSGLIARTQYRERNEKGTWYLTFKGKI